MLSLGLVGGQTAQAGQTQPVEEPERVLADRHVGPGEVAGNEGHEDSASAQQSALDRYIDVDVSNATVEEALRHVAEKAGVRLSYGSQTIQSSTRRVTLQDDRIEAKRALQSILEGMDIKIIEYGSARVILTQGESGEKTKEDATATDVRRAELTPVLQQQGTIRGEVTDAESGEPLPGVNVAVVGTQQGAATGADGQYTIRGLTAGTYTLRASFIGYEEKRIEGVTVEDEETTVVNIALETKAESLDEVVVVGYGEQEQRDVTGVVDNVSSADFNKAPTVSPDQLLQGKVSGVQIQSNSGRPGGQTFIRIRGGTSVNASNRPLFVVDGVPVNDTPHSPGGLSEGRNPLNFLNPSDIEDITVLKDASAAAIYGARGANGVILISTKQGSEQEQVSYSGSVSTTNAVDTRNMLDTQEFRNVVDEQFPALTSALGDADTDWQEAVLEPALGQQHSVSFSGGTSAGDRYRFSLGYQNEEGVLRTSETQRTSLSAKYSRPFLDDRVTLDVNLRGSKTDDQFAPSVIETAALFAPTQPIRDASNERTGYFEWSGFSDVNSENNPVATIDLTDEVGDSYRSVGNAEFEYEPTFVDGLSASANLGYDVASGERTRFIPTNEQGQFESDKPGQIDRANFTRLTRLLDLTLNYENRFEEINSRVNVTAGYSYQASDEKYPEISAQGLTTNVLGPNSTLPAGDINSFVSEVPNRLISSFGRINYTFKGRYVMTATIRRDASSRFAPSNRWGTFPSAALAWRIHNEEFMEPVTDVVSALKLRGSWGVTGNQEIGDFLYEKTFEFSGENARVQFGDDYVNTIRPSAVDPALKWEETTSFNLGLDYGLFQGRLSGSVNYYQKETNDLLFETTVPAGANLSDLVLTNVGSVRNTGVEFNLDAAVVQREEFSYNAQFNASTNDNELLKLTDFEAEGSPGIPTGLISGGVGNRVQILQEGQPVNSFYVYRHKTNEDGEPLTDGVDHNGDGEVNLADMYKDTNGDGEVTDEDRTPYKSPQPDWTFGHTSQVRYGGLDLSVSLRAHVGNYVYNDIAGNLGTYNRIEDFAPSNVHRSVRETNFDEPQYFSDYYVEDASFLRMDNVTLGYSFDGLAGVDRLRVYGSVSNVFVLTGYSGPEPEIGETSGVGIDNDVFPRTRTFTGGLNLQF
jgi:iron complex outermembrane receptor protein